MSKHLVKAADFLARRLAMGAARKMHFAGGPFLGGKVAIKVERQFLFKFRAVHLHISQKQ